MLNPGGPGGPGAWFALLAGKTLQAFVDPAADPDTAPSDAKYFDVIGFDPRGIGLTEPLAYCMPDKASAWSWQLRESDEGILGSSDAALGRLWSMAHAYGSSCKQAVDDEDSPDIKQFMSTASVARDMLEISERHAEYVAGEVAQLAASKARKLQSYHSTGYVPGEAKLQYWGFSYGTYLGSTFASLYPDRIGRAVLDGVVSAYDYTHSLGNGSLTDNEKAMDSYYTYCHRAGPEECPLAAPNSTVSDVKNRFQNILDSLYHNPLPINSPEGPEVLTWSDMKLIIFSSIYQPRIAFPILSEIFAAIEWGSGQVLDDMSNAYRYSHVYSCPINGSVSVPPVTAVATLAVLCGDGLDQSDVSKASFTEYWQSMNSTFPTGGSYWSTLKMRCAAWRIMAQYSFRGPFGGNTSHPLLFISNTADPVTPLRSGRVMQNLFPGSGLLIGDGAGHSSIAVPSSCTLGHIREYFQTGKLPPPGTVCVPLPSPWSLNSTDPTSPFYDPSLESANVITLQHDDEFDAMSSKLRDQGLSLMWELAENGGFGFERMLGSKKMQSFVKGRSSHKEHALFEHSEQLGR